MQVIFIVIRHVAVCVAVCVQTAESDLKSNVTAALKSKNSQVPK